MYTHACTHTHTHTQSKLQDTGINNGYHLRLEHTPNPPSYHQIHTLPTLTTPPPPYPAVQESGSHILSMPIVAGDRVSNKTVHFPNSTTSFYSTGAMSTNSGVNWSVHSNSSRSGSGVAGPSRVVVAETGVLRRPTQESGGTRVIYDKPVRS